MIKAIELFAGVGGFRLGLEATNEIEVVWANQWEPSRKSQDAYNCYRKHFDDSGIHSNQDICTVDGKSFNTMEVDLIVGGFPCQDYSVARSRSGENGIIGKKGVLFWEIVRLIRLVKPKYILLENVDRLLKSPSNQRGRDFSIILASLNNLGYTVEWRVIKAAEYGEGQRRRRLFILAIQNDHSFNKATETHDDSTILKEKGFFASAFPVSEESMKKHDSNTIFLSDKIIEIFETIAEPYFNAGIMR